MCLDVLYYINYTLLYYINIPSMIEYLILKYYIIDGLLIISFSK